MAYYVARRIFTNIMSSEQNEILLINNNNEFEVRYETFGINNDNNIEHDERAKISNIRHCSAPHTIQSNPWPRFICNQGAQTLME